MHALSTVCDPNDIFTEREKVELDRLTRHLRHELKCYCSRCSTDSKGLSVGIAAMMSIYRDFKTETKNATIDFADYLRKEWNLGSCNNDIIIVVPTKDRSVRSEDVTDTLTQFLSNVSLSRHHYYIIDSLRLFMDIKESRMKK